MAHKFFLLASACEDVEADSRPHILIGMLYSQSQGQVAFLLVVINDAATPVPSLEEYLFCSRW